MAATDEIIKHLNATCELQYKRIGEYGPKAIQVLEQVFNEQPALAARAACAVGYCNTSQALPLLRHAAQHQDYHVRMVVPHACAKISGDEAQEIIESMLDDTDAGVRKMALDCVSKLAQTNAGKAIRKIAESDSEEYLREKALRILDKL